MLKPTLHLWFILYPRKRAALLELCYAFFLRLASVFMGSTPPPPPPPKP